VSELIISLIPLALGVIMSPLAIMALVAVLVSRRARVNGVAFLIGWVIAVLIVSFVSLAFLQFLGENDDADSPLWLAIVRLLLGLLLVLIAVRVYRRGTARVKQMAAATSPADIVSAAPQLPGWLKAVDTFKPARSASLGLGIFLLNPVDVSCVVLAMVDIGQADVSEVARVVVIIVFVAISVSPIAIPVILTLVKGAKADPVLERVRSWIASHTSALNAGLLLLIGAMQIQKALGELF